MEAWKQLIHTALLGTEKAPNGAAQLPVSEAFAPLLQKIYLREAAGETKLLQAATALYLYRRCGVVPLSESTQTTIAEPETQAYCSAAATKILKEILKTDSTGLLHFWLLQCHSKGNIFPPELLHVVLEQAAQNRELQPLAVAGAGKRGEWLCSLNPDWNFKGEESGEDVWETGTTTQRTAFLKSVRTADPGKARALLEAVWGAEKADVREALLRTFEHTLTSADLPFLEKASGDKSKRVKALATEFLLQIPESAAVKAFEEQLRQSIQLQTTKRLLGLVSKTELKITNAPGDTPPQEGADQKAKGLTEGNAPLFDLIGATRFVPPSFWESHLQASPAEILELFQSVPHSKHYSEALRQATIRFGDTNWAPLFINRTGVPDMGLLPLLPPEDAKAYLLRTAQVDPAAVLDHYEAGGSEWLPEVAPQLLAFAMANPYTYNRRFFNNAVSRIPLSLLPRLDSFEPKEKASANDYAAQYAAQMWETTRDHLASLLTLKQETMDAFSGEGVDLQQPAAT